MHSSEETRVYGALSFYPSGSFQIAAEEISEQPTLNTAGWDAADAFVEVGWQPVSFSQPEDHRIV